MKVYVDKDGFYLGNFVDAPEDGILVEIERENNCDYFDGEKWFITPKRQKELDGESNG